MAPGCSKHLHYQILVDGYGKDVVDQSMADCCIEDGSAFTMVAEQGYDIAMMAGCILDVDDLNRVARCCKAVCYLRMAAGYYWGVDCLISVCCS